MTLPLIYPSPPPQWGKGAGGVGIGLQTGVEAKTGKYEELAGCFMPDGDVGEADGERPLDQESRLDTVWSGGTGSFQCSYP